MRRFTHWASVAALVAAGALAAGSASAADAPKSIRIGYALSLSGVNAQGAGTTTLPGYQLWVKDVNDAGGIMVKEFGKKIPIEVVQYDDTSNAETMLRLEEKLMSEDKVDFVLPPWSTGFNLAAAPIFAKYGYPDLVVTANANDEEDIVKQYPTTFFFLNQPPHFGGALIGGILNPLRDAGKINSKVAMLTVGDQFGAEFAAGFGGGLKANKYDIVLQKSYPLGAADLTNEVKEAKASGADTFIAGSYPPDTFMLAQTSMAQGFNPKIYYTAVGTAFAEFGGAFKEKAEGVLGIGGWNPALPGAMDYYQRQVKVTGHAPDGWASPLTYASLQILQQAIEKAGTLDRKKVLDTIINGGPWQTVSGPIDLKTHILEKQWGVGQWQKGQFVGVAPGDMAGAKPVIFPKPAW